MRKYIALLLITITLCIKAQAGDGPVIPGYLGMRSLITAKVGAMPPYFGGKFPTIYTGLDIDYVVARHITTGVRYGFTYAQSPINDLSTTFVAQVYGNKLPADRHMAHTIQWQVKLFKKRRNNLAPLGAYTLFAAGYSYATYKTNFYTGDYSGEEKISAMKVTMHDFVVSGGLGRNFIIGNRLVVNIDFLINFSLTGLGRMLKYDSGGYSYDIALLRASRAGFYNDFFQVRLGLGSLGF